MLPTGRSCRLCVNEGSLSGVIRHRPLGAGAQRLRHNNRKVSSGPNTRATAQPALGWQHKHTPTHTHKHTHPHTHTHTPTHTHIHTHTQTHKHTHTHTHTHK